MDAIENKEPDLGNSPFQQPPKKKVWKKITLIGVGALVSLGALIFFLPKILNLLGNDTPLIDDSDLRLEKITLPPESENAYFDFVKIEKTGIYEPEGQSELLIDIVTGKTWNDTYAEEVINKNIEVLQLFSEAARKPKFQNPTFADPSNFRPDTIMPSTSIWRRATRINAVQALYLARQKRSKEAFEKTLDIVEIGQKIQESQVSLLEYIIAIEIKKIGLETAQKIITLSDQKTSESNYYIEKLNRFYENEKGLTTAFKGEYQFTMWSLDIVTLNKEENWPGISAENRFYFQPNKTKTIFAEYARNNIQNVNKPCNKVQGLDLKILAPTSTIKVYITENVLGKLLHDIVAASLTNVITERKCNEDLLVGTTQTLIALKAFKNDKNEYPTSLSDLIPIYLTSIPEDPFDNKALKYSKEKKILYSIGKDLKDSGGSEGDDWREMEDPTFRIDF